MPPSPAMKRVMARVARMEATKTIAARGPMLINPATWYDADYWAGRKLYRAADGKGGWELRAYAPPAREWHGFAFVVEGLLQAVAPWRPRTAVDIGSGPGSFVGHLCRAGVDARGIDVSDDAVAHPARGAEGRIIKWDITRDGARLGAHDLVTATDLLEHVYETDLDAAIDAMLSCLAPGGLFFACICTAKDEGEVFTLLDEHTPVPFEREWQAVSGHVNVRPHDYWVRRFEAHGCRIRWAVMHRFAQAWAEDQRSGALGGVVSWGPRFILAAERRATG